jgi:two-component system, NtrC family, response regulator PilR
MANVKQILLVDDHFEMLEFLRSMLELSGQDYEVLAVPSAEEGLLELHRTKFDLLITDVRLPGMSGFDLVRRVRQLRPNVAIIMITAYSTPQGRKEAEALKVYRYFTKPLDTDAVLAAVYAALYGETAEPPTNTVFPHPSSPPPFPRAFNTD